MQDMDREMMGHSRVGGTWLCERNGGLSPLSPYSSHCEAWLSMEFRSGHSICDSLKPLPLSLAFGVVALLPRIAGSRGDREQVILVACSAGGVTVAGVLQLRAVATGLLFH